MTRARSQLLIVAGRLAVLGGSVGIAAGVAQATIGSRIPDWSGNKDQPVALGLLTVALGASVLVASRTLRTATVPRDDTLAAITLWLAAVAIVCSTTVGRLWAVPGVLLLAAAGVTLTVCGWQRFRSVVATYWLRGLLGALGVFELLMAVSAALNITVAIGLVAGGALIGAAILARPGKRTMIAVLVAATLPFAVLTWWTIVTPLLTVVAFVIGFAATGRSVRSTDAGTSAAQLDRQPVR
jgi:hypothetical protein